MANLDKPRQVVFNLLKTTWGIEHQDSVVLLADDYTASRFNASRKSALCREFVNVSTDKYPSSSFKPFEQTAAALVSAMHSAKRGPVENGAIAEYLSSDACSIMGDSLSRYGFDGTLYRNTMADIVTDEALSDTDKAHLATLLFCSAGCTGDVRRAVDETLTANKVMGARFLTTQAGDDAKDSSAGAAHDMPLFALLRVDSGGQGGRHVLSTDSAGTMIGRQSTEANAITDVDMSVSKRHARVWRDEEGRWWIEGLGSTNGTEVIDSSTQMSVVVELPATERKAGVEAAPVELHLADIIVLAGTTRFWVQAL